MSQLGSHLKIGGILYNHSGYFWLLGGIIALLATFAYLERRVKRPKVVHTKLITSFGLFALALVGLSFLTWNQAVGGAEVAGAMLIVGYAVGTMPDDDGQKPGSAVARLGLCILAATIIAIEGFTKLL